jgi:hypothetical protein
MENGNAPATKQDIIELKEEMAIARSENHHMYDDLRVTMRDIQTEILKAFYSFGQSNNKRIAEVEGNESALRSRVATIEDRLMEVEKRLNIPPSN